MLSFYLRELYLNNRLVPDHGLTLAERRLRLSNIEQPLYAVGCIQDHIAPWIEVFRVRDHLSVPIPFSLSSEGHVAGIVNPPSAKSRRRYWSGDVEPGTAPDDWLATQTPLQGSWWSDWAGWLSETARPTDFEAAHRIIAVSRREHEPMLREHFPEVLERIQYFEIGDLDVEAPATAIARLTQAIDLEIAALRSRHGV